MGVHDFICYIQRNGQCVRDLTTADEEEAFHREWCQDCDTEAETGEDIVCDIRNCDAEIEEGEDAIRATIVTIPANMRTAIQQWPLARFRDYPAVEEDYDWDAWDFEGPHGETGYQNVLSDSSCDNWPHQSMWVDGDSLHIVFQTGYYEAFVLGNDPEYVSWHTYQEIFNNRESAIPLTKRVAWNIITGGEQPADLIEYPIRVHCEPWVGTYTTTVPALYTKARLDALIHIPGVKITQRTINDLRHML